MVRFCEYCNKELEGNPRKRFCSNLCKANAWYHKNKKLKISGTKICEYCGKEFKLKTYNHKYCSESCGDKGYRCNNNGKRQKYEKEYRKQRLNIDPNIERKYRLKRLYGISKESLDEIFTYIQKKRCLICGKSIKKYYVDHSHKTNEFRGLLCNNCNIGLGNFKDNPLILIRAAKYLKGERYRKRT